MEMASIKTQNADLDHAVCNLTTQVTNLNVGFGNITTHVDEMNQSNTQCSEGTVDAE